MTNSLAHSVLQIVLTHSETSISQTLAIVGKLIPANQAVIAGKRCVLDQERRGKGLGLAHPRYTPTRLAELGRRDLVRRTLKSLARTGHIRRLSPGVYAPPLLKLDERYQGWLGA